MCPFLSGRVELGPVLLARSQGKRKEIHHPYSDELQFLAHTISPSCPRVFFHHFSFIPIFGRALLDPRSPENAHATHTQIEENEIGIGIWRTIYPQKEMSNFFYHFYPNAEFLSFFLKRYFCLFIHFDVIISPYMN